MLAVGYEENRTDELPTVLLDVVKVYRVTRKGVTMTSSVDTPPSQFLGVFVCQIPVVPLVQNTIRECATRSDGEDISFQPRPIRIDVVHLGPLCAHMCQRGAA